jgi:hypothetical protein
MPLPRAVPVTVAGAERTTLKNAPGARRRRTGIGCGPGSCWRRPCGRDNARIAADLRITVDTVRKWGAGSPAAAWTG